MADVVPGSKRRAHRKSRTGCLQCKERKIKVRIPREQTPALPLLHLHRKLLDA